MITRTKIWYGYGFFLLLAIILRFHQLNLPFLSEKEAAFALQAIDGSGTSGISAWLQIVFFLFGENEITARIIPAVFGLVLVLAPLFFTRVIGKEIAVVLSILLMFDPGLIAFSRQTNGAIITIAGLVIAFLGVFQKKSIQTGIAVGLAVLASPIFWPGLFALLFALWSFSIKRRKSDREIDFLPVWNKTELRLSFFSLILTVLLAGSGFGIYPAGVMSPVINLMEYITGWTRGDGISPFLMLFSFLLYQPFLLVIGLVEGIRSVREGNPLSVFLIRLLGFSLLLVILYPSRGMDALLIAYLPLLYFTARFIVRVVPSIGKPDLTGFGQMLLLVLLIPFMWMNLIVLVFPIEGQDAMLRLGAIIGAFILLVIASILIRLGWPPSQASTGLWMGLAVLFFVFMFSTAWRAAGLGAFPEAELWNYDGVTDEVDLLRDTASDLSEWNVMSRDGINIVMLNNSSAAIKWALRDFTSVNSDTSLPELANPAIVITENEEVPSLAQAYRGQDFVITKRTAWSLILPEEWIQWFAFRSLPGEKLEKVLWARTDLFPGAAKTAPETINPIQ